MDINGSFLLIAALAWAIKLCLWSNIELPDILCDAMPAKDAIAVDESIRTFHWASAYLALNFLRFL